MQPEPTEEKAIAEGAQDRIDHLLSAKYTEVYESVVSGSGTPRSMEAAERELARAREALFDYIMDVAKRAPEKPVEQIPEGTSVSTDKPPPSDPVNHPAHYTSHPSGVECIAVTEHFNFCVGNAIKYLWRAGLKNDAIEDLQKARWYVEREIQRRSK